MSEQGGEAFRIEGVVSIDSARALQTLANLDGVANKTAQALQALFTGVVAKGPRAIEGGIAQPAEKAAKKTEGLGGVLRQMAAQLSRMEAEVSRTATGLYALELATRKTEQAVAKSTREWVQAEQQLKQFERTAAGSRSQLEVLSDSLSEFLATAAITAPWAAAVKVATDFDAAMRRVNTIAKLNDRDLATLSTRLVGLGDALNLAVDPADAAAATYQILSSGITEVAASQKVLESAALASRAGFTDMETAATLLTSVLNAYGLTAEDAARVTDVMFKTVDQGVITFPQLAQGMGSVLGIAKSLGVSFEELNGIIAAATVKGIPAERTFSALRAVMSHFLSTSETGKETLDELKIEVDKNAVAAKGLAGVMKDLARAADGNDDAIRKVVEDVDAFNLVLTLTNDQGAAMDRTIKEVSNSAGAASSAAAERAKSAQDQIDRFWLALKGLGIEVGTTLLPRATELVRALTDLVKWFRGTGDATKDLTIGIAAVSSVSLLAIPRLVGLAKWITELRAASAAGAAVQGLAGATEAAGAAAGAAATGPMAKLAFVLGRAGIYGAVAALIAVPVAIAIDQWSKSLEEVDKKFNATANSARDFGTALRDIPPPPQDLVDPSGRLGDWSQIKEGSKEAAELTKRWNEELERAEKALQGQKDPLGQIQAAIEATAAQYDHIRANPELFPNAEKDLREIQNILSFYEKLKDRVLAKTPYGPAVPTAPGSGKDPAADERARREKAAAKAALAAWEEFKKKREAGGFATKDAELRAHDQALAGLKRYAAAGKAIGKDYNDALKDATWARVRLQNQVEQEHTREHQREVSNRLKDSLAAIDAELKAGRISYEVAVQRMQDLQDANKAILGEKGMEDERRGLDTRIASTEEAGRDDRAKKAQKAAEAEAKAASAAAESKDKEIDLAKARGASATEIMGLLRQKATLQEEVVQKALEGDLKEARSRTATSKEIQAIEAEAAEKVKQIRLDLAKDLEDLDDQELDRRKRILDLQGQLRDAEASDIDRQIQNLETGVENGTVSVQAVSAQAEVLLQRRHALTLQTLREEARLQLEAAVAAGASAEEQALIRAVNAKKEVDAVRDAEDEIKKIRDKTAQDAKAAQAQAASGPSGPMSLADMQASLSSSMGIDAVRAQIAAQIAANNAPRGATPTAGESHATALGMLQAEKARMEQSLADMRSRNEKGTTLEDTSGLEGAIQALADKIGVLTANAPATSTPGGALSDSPFGPGTRSLGDPPVPGSAPPVTPATTAASGVPGAATAGPTSGKTEVQVHVKIDVDGEVKVSKGPLSSGTTKGLVDDLGLMDYVQGDYPGSLGRAT